MTDVTTTADGRRVRRMTDEEVAERDERAQEQQRAERRSPRRMTSEEIEARNASRAGRRPPRRMTPEEIEARNASRSGGTPQIAHRAEGPSYAQMRSAALQSISRMVDVYNNVLQSVPLPVNERIKLAPPVETYRDIMRGSWVGPVVLRRRSGRLTIRAGRNNDNLWSTFFDTSVLRRPGLEWLERNTRYALTRGIDWMQAVAAGTARRANDDYDPTGMPALPTGQRTRRSDLPFSLGDWLSAAGIPTMVDRWNAALEASGLNRRIARDDPAARTVRVRRKVVGMATYEEERELQRAGPAVDPGAINKTPVRRGEDSPTGSSSSALDMGGGGSSAAMWAVIAVAVLALILGGSGDR